MLKMTFLEQLYRKMKDENRKQCLLKYHFRNVDFSVLFDIGLTPFNLLFGVIIKNFTFSFSVERGFYIKDWRIRPESKYKQLAEILQLKPDPANPFSPLKFLEEFNRLAKMPDKVRQLTYSDRIPFCSAVEESKKISFKGWQHHENDGRNVRPKNLEKTRMLLGETDYQRCEQRNISTCWTDNPDEEQDPSITRANL
jgi:hypothetical protein